MKPDNYFEGILQLRDVSQEVLDYVEDACLQGGEKMVAYVKEDKNGYDFYMRSNTFLKKLARWLGERFTGEVKSTYTLHTRDTKNNKDLYRLTVLFRQHDIAKGDLIEVRGVRYYVTGVGKKVLLKEEKTGRKAQMTFEELKKENASRM